MKIRINKIIAINVISLLVLAAVAIGFSRAEAASSVLDNAIPSVAKIMEVIDAAAIKYGNGAPGTIWGAYGSYRTIYVPSGKNWIRELTTHPTHYAGTPFLANTGFRQGLMQPYVSAMRDSIIGNAANDENLHGHFMNEVVRSLQHACIQQCTNNSTWYQKYLRTWDVCVSWDSDGGGCNNWETHYTPKSNNVSMCITYECETQDNCAPSTVCANPSCTSYASACQTIPFDEQMIEKFARGEYDDRNNRYVYNDVARESIKCYNGTYTVRDYTPTWCHGEKDPDSLDVQGNYCTQDDYEMACLRAIGALPKITEGALDTMSYLDAILSEVGLNGGDPSNFGDWLGSQFQEQMDEVEAIVSEYFPEFAAGGSVWNKTPGDTSITGFCNNVSGSSCSCFNTLPVNNAGLTQERLQSVVASWGRENAGEYCVNESGTKHCVERGYAWTDRNDDVNMRNIYSSRAAYPGWIDDKFTFHAGGLCGNGGKGKSGGTEKKERSYTDNEFWAGQARWFETYVRPVNGARQDINSDYGGCDDRSDMLFSHNTSASCQRKKSSAPKCRSGSRTYSSWACAENGSVINQCSTGFSAGRNTSCQVCGPIYCGSMGMFSDTNTVAQDYAFRDKSNPNDHGPATRHYKLTSTTTRPVGAGAVSYKTIATLGATSDSGFNDSIFGGNVLPDRTCESVNGAGSIVDPCSQTDSSLTPNNWGGHRRCYERCCVSSDGRTCDYLKARNCAPGVCCTDPGIVPCGNVTFNDYEESDGSDDYCGLVNGATVRGYEIKATENINEVCEIAGQTDRLYSTGSVGKAYYVQTGGSQCALCSCSEIAGNDGASGWWPSNALLPSASGACANGGVTVAQKCEELYGVATNGYRGYDGVATATTANRQSLLKSAGVLSAGRGYMTRQTCQRCRCVAGDGICDGCPNDPNGACSNYETGYYDPDCGGSCPNTCNNDDTCNSESGENCDTCPDDCGTCDVSDTCPDGYSKLCRGEPYNWQLPNCLRCMATEEDDAATGSCGDPDGYCNPLCKLKDADCDPVKDIYNYDEEQGRGECPDGYCLTNDPGCRMPNGSYGAVHPFLPNCFAKEDCSAAAGSLTCDNHGGIGWELMTRAQQEKLYQDSRCYGYQIYSIMVYNPILNNEVSSFYYDYQQRVAWMSDNNADGLDFKNPASQGGYRRCRPPMMPNGGQSANAACEYRCVPQEHELLVLSCSEIDARFPDEFGVDQPSSGSYIFIPDITRSAGNKNVVEAGLAPELNNAVKASQDTRCGRYYRSYTKPTGSARPGVDVNGDGVINDSDFIDVNGDGLADGMDDFNGDGIVDYRDLDAKTSYLYTDWWQAGGSAYGNQGIGNYGEGIYNVMNPNNNDGLENPATAGYVHTSQQYALTDGICNPLPFVNVDNGAYNPPPNGSLASGMQVTGTGGLTTQLKGYQTRRSSTVGDSSNSLTSQDGYTYQANQQRPLDWQYYTTKFDYNNGWTGNTKTVDDVTVYKRDGDVNFTSLAISGRIENGDKRVYFINGNLILDYYNSAPYTLDSASGGYLAFIISGDLIINHTVGEYITDGCDLNTGSLCNRSLDAVVVARGLQILVDHDVQNSGVDSLFNAGSNLFCDRRLVLAGAYSFWGGEDIVFTRSLTGCGFKQRTNVSSANLDGYPNGTDTLNIHDGADPDGVDDDHDGRMGTVFNKNQTDQYCRTYNSGYSGGFGLQPNRNGNGYWDYTPYSSSGMYNNYNRLFSGTQIIVNPDLINNTPEWMKENSSTRLEVQ